MKILINIDEDMLTDEEIEECIKLAKTDFSDVTVIQKGHGDLIDRDELRNVCANNQVDIMNDGNKNTLIIVDKDDKDWHDLLSEKYAPTVISADKENNDD